MSIVNAENSEIRVISKRILVRASVFHMRPFVLIRVLKIAKLVHTESFYEIRKFFPVFPTETMLFIASSLGQSKVDFAL